MKPNMRDRLRWNEGEIVTSFGATDLIRHYDGRWELSGGSPADHAAARKWSSLLQRAATFPSAPLPATACVIALLAWMNTWYGTKPV